MTASFDRPPRLPSGFRCASVHCGLKPKDPDLALFLADRPGSAAGLFTRNHFPGAPIVQGREQMVSGRLQGVIVNAGISNVATGSRGLADARTMREVAARAVEIDPELMLVGSTGVIGRPLPMDRVEAGIRKLPERLGDDPLEGARGIMTTDRVPKAFSMVVGESRVTVVGKGAGMIAPNLATMLVYFFTDAEVDPKSLDGILRRSAEESFQLLSVDTDTSTSDMVVALASGRAGPVEHGALEEAFRSLSLQMAEAVGRDGEGATKLLRIEVAGAADAVEARRIARAIAESPLVKTMAYGRDPNVGRILMAVGKCVECRVVPERVRAQVQGVEVIREGVRVDFDESRVRELLGRDEVEIQVSLDVGEGAGRAIGCDLTEGYIEENTAYASS